MNEGDLRACVGAKWSQQQGPRFTALAGETSNSQAEADESENRAANFEPGISSGNFVFYSGLLYWPMISVPLIPSKSQMILN